jgi:short-subunit dehydrogenase
MFIRACFAHRFATGNAATQVSSVAGQVGVFGYTAYSASKFALTGFAQCLQMELKRDNVYVSLLFPPDTDTPMFVEENKIKPAETKEISKASACDVFLRFTLPLCAIT